MQPCKWIDDWFDANGEKLQGCSVSAAETILKEADIPYLVREPGVKDYALLPCGTEVLLMSFGGVVLFSSDGEYVYKAVVGPA